MSLAPGSRLGPYEVVAPICAGGMGEVYRARDSRLGREVAVKVLPADLASDQERISPEGYRSFLRGVGPDGKTVVARGPDQRLYLYPTAGGEPSAIPGLTPEDTPSGWSADSRSLYVFRRRELPAKVYRLEVATGRKELWRELMPSDPAGVAFISPPRIAADGQSYSYAYVRTLSDLYLLEGIK